MMMLLPIMAGAMSAYAYASVAETMKHLQHQSEMLAGIQRRAAGYPECDQAICDEAPCDMHPCEHVYCQLIRNAGRV